MNIKFNSLLAVIAVATLAIGCKQTPDPNNGSANYQDGVYAVCEGGFLAGNASISYIHADGDTVSTELFDAVNNVPLGDVAQSMVTRGGLGYIVVNNSAKIEVVNLVDFTSAGTINDLGSPRFIHFISDTKAYVTDLFNNMIHIVNPATMMKVGSISMNGWGEEMIESNGKVLVVAPNAGQVYKIDPSTDSIEDSVAVGTQPFGLVTDANGKVWTLASGGWMQDIPHLYRFDPVSFTVEATMAFNTVDENPGNLSIDPTGVILYYINGDVFSLGIGATAIPSSPLIGSSAATGSFYKMAVQPITGDLFVSDPIDFTQTGLVYRFNSAGTLLKSYDVGIAPGGFHFIGN